MTPPWPPTSPVSETSTERTTERARPLTEQIQIIRELWLLREQARVQAAERQFLVELQRLLASTTHTQPPHPPAAGGVRWGEIPVAPPLRPRERGEREERVYESIPVNRGVAREIWGGDGGVEEARARQRVTNLNPEFRAVLEGEEREERREGVQVGNRNVSLVLEGEFGRELENLLVRGGRRARERTVVVREEEEYGQEYERGVVGGNSRLESVVRALQDEVQALKNVVGASFDLQLEVQRSIRQEVSAALNQPARIVGGSDVFKGGCCAVCLEKRVDSLLYACGHMCTCIMCGRQLVAGGGCCPICRAPVRDVVRAYMVTE